MNENVIMKALDWAYEQAIAGLPSVFESASELAATYAQGPGSLEERASRLVTWQVAKAGTTGFLTGLGGVITMPLTIPASLASVLLIQTRMIAAVAHVAGHDVRSDQVRTLAYVCMCGNAGKDILKNTGIKVGTRVAQKVVERISGQALVEINKRVGFRLLTKFGEKGIINLGKMIPLVGGIVGGTFDGLGTHSVGKIAIEVFLSDIDPEPVTQFAAE